jgi:hypothetical protein
LTTRVEIAGRAEGIAKWLCSIVVIVFLHVVSTRFSGRGALDPEPPARGTCARW